MPIAEEAKKLLEAHLDCWFPRCVCERGGFHQAFARDWTPLPNETRFQVFQARMIWVAATAAEALPERREEFLGYVQHGLPMLRSVWLADLDGKVRDWERRAYGTAFEAYALAAAARVLGSAELAERARKVLLEELETLHDREFGGWYESPGAGTEKVFNSHLHIFEAVLEVERVAPGKEILALREECIEILSERMGTESGRMNARFSRDWRPLGDDWEIGHDLEAAFLLLLSGTPGVQEGALRTIDFALEHGFDGEFGGFFQTGQCLTSATPQGPNAPTPSVLVVDATKIWWTQDEGLNALVFACRSSSKPLYREALAKQWAWVRDRQYDSEFGGTFARLAPEGELLGDGQKAEPWKACYHDVRALVNLMKVTSASGE